jgi:hypothetical protein
MRSNQIAKETYCGLPSDMKHSGIPCLASIDFKLFLTDWELVLNNFAISTRYAQSNGLAERGIQTIKMMFKKSDDPYIALLSYRATPLDNGHSPAELLMGRK